MSVDLKWLRDCLHAPGGPGDLGTKALAEIVEELQAHRTLLAEVSEFLRADVALVEMEDGKKMQFRAPSLKVALQMIVTDREMVRHALTSSRDEYAKRVYDLEHGLGQVRRKADAGEKLRRAIGLNTPEWLRMATLQYDYEVNQ